MVVQDPSAEAGRTRELLDAGAAPRIRVRGDIDIASVPSLQARITAALTKSPWLELDLSEVTFFGSTGVRELLEARDEARRAGGGIALVAASAPVRRVLDLTGVASKFPAELHGSR